MFLHGMMTLIQNEKIYCFHLYYTVPKYVEKNLSQVACVHDSVKVVARAISKTQLVDAFHSEDIPTARFSRSQVIHGHGNTSKKLYSRVIQPANNNICTLQSSMDLEMQIPLLKHDVQWQTPFKLFSPLTNTERKIKSFNRDCNDK
ncbi:hypothetical protein ACJIZ3_006217 [Penstemon smallii]|uniref:Uncharacterized protein n=1 Tax=Penstemon smallii TaxID=265156 RepID=A0ABD3S7F3_9LAMI